MDCPPFDFHIHTKHLGCANQTMEVNAILTESAQVGVKTLGITDHLNHPDQLEKHIPIRDDLRAAAPTIDVFFGVELNFTGQDQGFVLDQNMKAEMGFQYAIGGIHGTYVTEYDLRKIIDIHHRHHLKTCRDPIVDVLVHPYWFNKGGFDKSGFPWENQMKAVPESYARELGQTARETNTAVEINGEANIHNHWHVDGYREMYFDFLSAIAEEGAAFSLGSDAHDIKQLTMVKHAWEIAQRLDLGPDRIWKPAGAPFKAPAA